MGDLCVSEARGVIFEGNLVFPLIDAEFAQAVGVGEFSEALELLKAQRRLKFVGNFEERHGGDYSSSGQPFDTEARRCGGRGPARSGHERSLGVT